MKKILGISLISIFCYGGVITNIEGVNPSEKTIEKKDFNCEKEIYKKYKLKDPKNDSFEGYLINVTERPGLTYKELEEGRAFLLDYLNENNEKELAEDLLLNFKGPIDINKLEKYCSEYKEIISPKKEIKEEKKVEIKETKNEKETSGIILAALGVIVLIGSLLFKFKKRL